MYTGYFAKLKKYESTGLIPISICGKAPDWYQGLQYKKLAPKWEFFNEWKNGKHKGDNDYYIAHFKSEVLDNLDINEVLDSLCSHGALNKIILICYEKPADFCHRHLVADWLNENGIECTEFSE